MPPCVHPDRAAEFHAYDTKESRVLLHTKPMIAVIHEVPAARRKAKKAAGKAIRANGRSLIAEQLDELEEERIAADFEETERMAQAERDAEDYAMYEAEEERHFYASLAREQRERYLDDGFLDFTASEPEHDPFGTTFEGSFL